MVCASFLQRGTRLAQRPAVLPAAARMRHPCKSAHVGLAKACCVHKLGQWVGCIAGPLQAHMGLLQTSCCMHGNLAEHASTAHLAAHVAGAAGCRYAFGTCGLQRCGRIGRSKGLSSHMSSVHHTRPRVGGAAGQSAGLTQPAVCSLWRDAAQLPQTVPPPCPPQYSIPEEALLRGGPAMAPHI